MTADPFAVDAPVSESDPFDVDPISVNLMLPPSFGDERADIPAGIEDKLRSQGSEAVYGAIQNASNSTDRSKQAADFRMGVSNLGHCRQYAKYVTEQTEPTDETDKTAAFIGTVLGEAIEARLKVEHPDWLFQSEATFNIPSGGAIDGHPDIVVPDEVAATVEEYMAQFEEDYDGEELFIQGVWDLKSKDKLKVVRKYGQTQQQIFQLHAYTKALIDAGILDDSKPIWVQDVYYDRSGAEHEAYTIGHWYDPNVIDFIDHWINDVKYAVINQVDAEKDMPRDWCFNWCEYATLCRANDTDVEGLVDDPEFIAAVDTHVAGSALVKEGKAMVEAAKLALANRQGSTGKHKVRWIEIGESTMNFKRPAYKKLDVRKVPAPKPPKAPRKPRKKKATDE